MTKYELLAPAGSFETLVTAIKAGADAIYFGLKEFSLRDNAKNFELKDLDEINETCGTKVKKYLTLNSIIYDEELERVEEVIKKVKGKVDAIICWDLAVINLCRKYNIPFHISTQGSVANSEAAKFYKSLGAERVILARELSLEQIKEISKVAYVEAFIHGAMCIAVSGRCLMSQFLFNRSANRGQCIHPCRRSYIVKDKQSGYELEVENDKVFSAKDLCTLPLIEEMKKAGVKSFKIEGRNRDPRYVDTVVRIYRKALDNKLTIEEVKKGMEELDKIYNKGFSTGFYLGKPDGRDIASMEHSASHEHKHFIGKITHYYPKVGVGTVKLVSEVKVGDKGIIIGRESGLEKFEIKRIEIHNKSVEKAGKGEEIGLKLPRVRIGEDVYIIKKS